MKNLNRNEKIAVFISVALVAYIFFSGPIMSTFNLGAEPVNESSKSEELIVEEIAAGTGEIAEPGDIITVHYTGRLSNGQVFESSVENGSPINFMLGVGQVIRGWDEGVSGMREGGKRVLTIPPSYGYGDAQAGPIPPNSTIIFEVELINVEKQQGATQ